MLAEERLGVVDGGRLLAGLSPLELGERRLRLARRASVARRRLEVLTRLAEVPEVEEGEAAAVLALGVDLRDLVHDEELREAIDRSVEERVLALLVGRELRALIADPGEVVGDHERGDLGIAPAPLPVELLDVAVALHNLVAHLVHAVLELVEAGLERLLEVGEHRAGLLLLAALEEIVERLRASLEIGGSTAAAARGRSSRVASAMAARRLTPTPARSPTPRPPSRARARARPRRAPPGGRRRGSRPSASHGRARP